MSLPDNKRGRIFSGIYHGIYYQPVIRPSIIALYGVADKTPVLISVFIHIISIILF